MYLVLVTALFAICGADKLDRTYLPPASAKTAGGTAESLHTPFRTFNQGLGGIPKGGYKNEFEGVVVDAAAAGTRASGSDGTGLGGPRISYGSTHSKVGDAAFTADTAFPRIGAHSGLSAQGVATHTNGAHISSTPERIQAPRDRASNIVTYQNDVSPDSFNYAFETDNGIVAREDGIEANGVNAQGGYSYTGDDGQVYSVTYTADERGYQPSGDHLPTPPPIPEEILKSLEQNAKDEASGVVDDGSYDAQKYNVEEDYTKSDSANGKYNAQPRPLGSRPQFDTDASSSFNSQNNQAIARPGFSQFGSIPVKTSATGTTGFQSNDSSKTIPPSGNNYGNINIADKIAGNGQASGLESGSNNEYLPPSSVINQNRGPGLNRPQSNLPSGFNRVTGLSPSINVNTGVNGAQNSNIPAFIPLSQQKLQGENFKRPQSNSPVFGKPTIIDSTLAIKDPFSRRPSLRPQGNRPVGGSFQVVSGNVYSSKNEYLPPRIQFNKLGQNKGNQGSQVNDYGKKQSYANDYNSLPTTTFEPLSRPTFGFQSSQTFSAQQGGSGNNLPTDLSQTVNNQPSVKDQSQFSPSFSNLNQAPNGQTQYRPSNFASQFPTLQPQTELMTPFESTSDRNGLTESGPNIDSHSSTFTGSNNIPTFNSQLSTTFAGQSGFNTHKIDQVSPTQSSTPAFSSVSSHLSTSGIQNAPVVGLIKGNSNSNFPNKFPGDAQYASSTQRPSYSQNSQHQGSDDSYYYNKPSRVFNVPTARPLSSIIPSSPFDQQFKVTQSPFGTRDQPSVVSQSSLGFQNNVLLGSTKNPSPLESVSPTLPSRPDERIDTTLQSQFNRVTQASASSFLSPAPTVSSNFQQNKFNQYSTSQSAYTNPQFVQENQSSSLFNQPPSIFAQAIATSVHANQRVTGLGVSDSSQGPSSQFKQTQQYNSEVYEYKKPPQTLPAPQNSPTNKPIGHTSPAPQNSPTNKPIGHTSQFGTVLNRNQDNQPQNSQNAEPGKPSSQFGSIFTQQTVSSFGHAPQNIPVSQGNQAFTINEQLQNQPQSESRPAQFGPIPSKPSQGFQITPGSQGFNANIHIQTQPQTDSKPGQYDFLSSKPAQNSELSLGNQASGYNTQGQARPQTEPKPGQLGSRPSEAGQSPQPVQGASKFPPVYDTDGPACCKRVDSQSSQSQQQNGAPPFEGQIGAGQGQEEQSFQGTKPIQSISSFPSSGESFGGPRKPPSFDADGYHY